MILNETNLESVDPKLQAAVTGLAEILDKLDIDVNPYQTLTTDEEYLALYSQGRTGIKTINSLRKKVGAAELSPAPAMRVVVDFDKGLNPFRSKAKIPVSLCVQVSFMQNRRKAELSTKAAKAVEVYASKLEDVTWAGPDNPGTFLVDGWQKRASKLDLSDYPDLLNN